MNKTAFALAALAAVAAAEMTDLPTQTSNAEDNGALGKIKAWNCLTCTAAFKGIDKILDAPKFRNPIISGAVWACNKSGKIHDPEICPMQVERYATPLFDAMSGYLFAKDRWCNEKLNVCTHMKVEHEDLHQIVDNILATKPLSLANDDFVDNLYEQIAAEMIADDTEREIIRAVHITDVHIDSMYAAGSKAKCGSFLCCRASFGIPAAGEPVAGEWGDNEGVCDIPEKTFVNLMEFVVAEIAPDAIFWTGDNSSHNIWSNTVEEVTGYTETVTNIIKNAIKDTDITVMPIHGNHDTWPVDE